MKGVLRVRGTIDLAQFWPQGDSDADTSKVKVTVGRNAFMYAADGRRFRQTHVFEHARVVGAASGPVIDAASRITVRLQGIDAPELHFRAAGLARSRRDVTPERRAAYNAANKVERRQFWAESATVALARKLGRYGAGQVPCLVDSLVDHPYEVVDTYGRVVGTLRVGTRFGVDLNEWLAREGWAFPTFYSSMTPGEILALRAAGEQGRRTGRVWAGLSGDTSRFRAAMHYRPGGAPQPAADQGRLIMPKLFRRQVAYEMERAAGLAPGTFAEFLARKPDECFLTSEFLAQGEHSAPTRRLHEFMSGRRFGKQPHELVFRERFSSVVDPQGRRIESF